MQNELFEYEVSDDNSITITKYFGTETDVTIPAEINGKPVTKIGDYTFHDHYFTYDGFKTLAFRRNLSGNKNAIVKLWIIYGDNIYDT